MIVIIDIGSHKCQEFKVLFHTNPLLLKANFTKNYWC